MKKLFILGVVFTLLVASASAQVTSAPIQHQRTEQGVRTEGRHTGRDGRWIHHKRHHRHRHGFHRRHNGRRRMM